MIAASDTPRAAYIHVPFCARRCGYCNFTLVVGRDDLQEAYLAAVERELTWLIQPREVDTLYFGGGTPTHLSPDRLARLLQTAGRWFPLAKEGECTVEANPADIHTHTLDVLAEAGVGRISLGVQSFHAQKLELLQRDHDPQQSVRAVQLARQYHANLCLDLIFGVPEETEQVWQADLDMALQMNPDHVSTYGLTFERGTSYWSRQSKGQLQRTDEELERSMYLTAIDRLTGEGLEHYEVSNFSRPGYRSRHNQAYWTGQGYYAAGPGAARFVQGRRETNHRSTTTYLKRMLSGQSPVAESEELSPEQRARERLVFGLRLLEGIDSHQFLDETGFTIDSLIGHPLQNYLAQGWLQWRGRRLCLSRAGLLVSDGIWPDFIGD